MLEAYLTQGQAAARGRVRTPDVRLWSWAVESSPRSESMSSTSSSQEHSCLAPVSPRREAEPEDQPWLLASSMKRGQTSGLELPPSQPYMPLTKLQGAGVRMTEKYHRNKLWTVTD